MKINLSTFFLYLAPISIFLATIPTTGNLSLAKLQTIDEVYREGIANSQVVGIQEEITGLVLWGFIYLIAFMLASKILISYRNTKNVLLMLALLTIPPTLSLFITQNLLGTLSVIVHLIGVALIGLCSAHLMMNYRDRFLNYMQFAIMLCLLGHLIFSLILPEYSYTLEGRFRGASSNPNTIARVALIAFLITIGFRKVRPKRILEFLSISISCLVLFLTQSITAIFCAVFGAISIFLFTRISSLHRNFNLFLLSIVVISPFFYMLISAFLEDFLNISNRDITLTGRTFIWAKAIELISAKPVFGWGFANLAIAFESTNFAVSSYHNGFLDTLVKGGFITLACFIAILLKYLGVLRVIFDNDRPFCITFLLIFFLINISESTIYAPKNSFWIIFCFVLFYLNLYQIKHQKNT